MGAGNEQRRHAEAVARTLVRIAETLVGHRLEGKELNEALGLMERQNREGARQHDTGFLGLVADALARMRIGCSGTARQSQ